MLVKHVFVVGFVALGVIVNRLVRRVAEATGDEARGSSLRWLGLCAEGATGLGALIALMTAAAQVAA